MVDSWLMTYECFLVDGLAWGGLQGSRANASVFMMPCYEVLGLLVNQAKLVCGKRMGD
jgi:hypothetical protein